MRGLANKETIACTADAEQQLQVGNLFYKYMTTIATENEAKMISASSFLLRKLFMFKI
jgi:hypothetical protein